MWCVFSYINLVEFHSLKKLVEFENIEFIVYCHIHVKYITSISFSLCLTLDYKFTFDLFYVLFKGPIVFFVSILFQII